MATAPNPESDYPPSDMPPPAPEPLSVTADDRTWGMLAHLSALIATALSTMGFIGPLIVWLIKKDQSKFVDYHGKESLNFQLNMLIYMLIALAVTFATCGIGFPLPMAVGIYGMVMCIIAGIKANKGELYEYPYTFRLIK
jgi:hypothetical protein